MHPVTSTLQNSQASADDRVQQQQGRQSSRPRTANLQWQSSPPGLPPPQRASRRPRSETLPPQRASRRPISSRCILSRMPSRSSTSQLYGGQADLCQRPHGLHGDDSVQRGELRWPRSGATDLCSCLPSSSPGDISSRCILSRMPSRTSMSQLYGGQADLCQRPHGLHGDDSVQQQQGSRSSRQRPENLQCREPVSRQRGTTPSPPVREPQ